MIERTTTTTYKTVGVDTEQEESALSRLKERVKGTWPKSGEFGEVKLDIGYFANVLDIGGGRGLAISADGVGTKVLIAQMMHKYDTVGIDCVAMNVNDIICVGARPLSMVDYIATQRLNPDVIDEIMKGLCEGARQARISIPGGEIAQVRDLIRGIEQGSGFDIAGAAVGMVDLDKIIVGEDIRDGDAVIGIKSNGVHSNGLTMAREVLLERHNLSLATTLPGLASSLGEELLRETFIYVPEVLDVIESKARVKALIHITSDGFLNLPRVAAPHMGYVIESLPPVPPIFDLIQKRGGVPNEEMYSVFNMGVGFCIVVAPEDADKVISIVKGHKREAEVIGHAVNDEERSVVIQPVRLKGIRGKGFWEAG